MLGEAHQAQLAGMSKPPAEMRWKSRLVATEVACGNRDDCFAGTPPLKALCLVVSLAASGGRRLAFFDAVGAFEHALIDELVILLLPGGLRQGRTAVLFIALHGTRKSSTF